MAQGGPDIKAIFTQALRLLEGAERSAYLDEACGNDDGLRRRVEALLAAYARADDVFGQDETITNEDAVLAGAGQDSTEAIEPAEPGQTIGNAGSPGDHEATTAIGPSNRDGLARGDVIRYFGDYEIRKELGRGGMGVVYEARQVSLNRPVALKMVKAGLLAGDDELRRFRNEAEAVALLDHPGIVPVYEVGEHNGQQYFSMKLVSGGSLMPLLARYKDDPKGAARLVALAAEAVAHAHARGILHRDLKPANILVDAEGRPHVTDFGLAKKVEADVEFTLSGAILGSPPYMSPEQAAGRRGSITTATDVYGLGAVLYALLTGTAPFGGDSAAETIDAVRNRAPEPPTRLNERVPRDLETICLKCLEKDPRRRYGTAQALADDLYAWLESRPIAARRVGLVETAWLWCKRRPAVAALSAAVVLATVGGTAGIIALQAKANADLRAANTRVEQRYKLAVDAIRTFHTGVSEDFLLQQDQFKELRDRLLKSAADFYAKLSALLEKEKDRSSRRALAASNFELAELTGKVGRAEDALSAHRAVLGARQALAAEPGADAGVTADIGRSLTAVASLLEAIGKVDEAVAAYRRSESLLAGPAGSDPVARAALAVCRSWLGWLLLNTGKTADALAAYKLARADQEALAGAPGATSAVHRDLAGTVNRVGALLLQTGQPAEAEAEYRRAIATYQRLVDDNPALADLRHRLATSHSNLGDALLQGGKPRAAEAEYRQAMAIHQKLVDDNLAVAVFRTGLARDHSNLGWLLSQVGKPAEAEAEYRTALALYKRLADDNPRIPSHYNEAANTHNNLSVVLRRLGRPAEALDHCKQAVTVREALVREDPVTTVYRGGLAESHLNRGLALRALGDPAAAAADVRRAVAVFEALESRTGEHWFLFACSHAALAGLAGQAGSSLSAAEGDEAADRAMALVRMAVATGYRNADAYRTEDALDPLRGQDDFRLLLMDLAFPAEPFARSE
jgi:tetratricopeptide (TPR) repeat protein